MDAGIGSSSFVYAIGRLELRFPSLAIEKELAQAIGKAGTANLTDREAMHAVLSRPEHFYLVRQLCWVLTIKSTDAYLVVPRDPEDTRMLLGALRPNPRAGDIDVVVGWIGPLGGGRACNGVQLPTLTLAQLYSFDIDEFVHHLPKPEQISDQTFAATVQEVIQRICQLSENLGYRDDHRVLNYLVTRDPLLYKTVADRHVQNSSLATVKVNVSPLSGARNVMDAVLEFRNRATDVLDKVSAQVDVTEVFPFLISKWGPYTDR
jgi:hypothetical protein